VVAAKVAAAGYSIVGWVWAIPGALALAGLVQRVSGVPFSELSPVGSPRRAGSGGRRGTFIFIVASAAVFGAFTAHALLTREAGAQARPPSGAPARPAHIYKEGATRHLT